VAEPKQGTSETAPRRGDWEWFWRFLAAVMLFVVGWVIWIAIQISPRALVTPAAYEAAAHANARSAKGLIVAAPQGKAVPGPQPPVNVEKLRLSESIESPVPRKPSGK
jgi:hypothetical protein